MDFGPILGLHRLNKKPGNYAGFCGAGDEICSQRSAGKERSDANSRRQPWQAETAPSRNPMRSLSFPCNYSRLCSVFKQAQTSAHKRTQAIWVAPWVVPQTVDRRAGGTLAYSHYGHSLCHPMAFMKRCIMRCTVAALSGRAGNTPP